MEIKNDTTLSEWFKESRAQNHSFPLSMCHGIEIAMKELNISFPEVFELFLKRAIIIQAGKMFIYDLRGYKALIPEGLHKCEACGEYKGEATEKDLSPLDKLGYETKGGAGYLEVSCLCDGILCPTCKKNKIHRPISNSYDEEGSDIVHHSYMSWVTACGECRVKQNKPDK